MKSIRALLPIILIVLAGCTSLPHRPSDATNYERDLIAPEMTEDYVLTEKRVFDEPALGVMLRYRDKHFPEDIISIYVYPINNTSWDDKDSALHSELTNVLNEIDLAIEYGHYQSRTPEVVSDFSFQVGDNTYSGKKAQLTITNADNMLLYSDVYMFLAEDKYIKFRTSFDARMTKGWTGDKVVEGLLPEIKVPAESAYMRNLRVQHKKKMQNDLMRLLMEAANQISEEAGERKK